jgi:hypothetical protein
MSRAIVALKSPRTYGGILALARLVAERLGSDPALAPTTPSLEVFQAHVDALATAMAKALTRSRVEVAGQRAAVAVVRQDLMAVRSHVQSLADTDPVGGRALIEIAGMHIKRAAGPRKPPFDVKEGPVQGSVRLFARAEKTRASYEWQYSLDGVTWVSVETTVKANARISGLPVGARVFFRYRAVTKAGTGDFCPPRSLIVV